MTAGRRLVSWRVWAGLAVALVALTTAGPPAARADSRVAGAAPTRAYRVVGNHILDPAGRRFVMVGATPFYSSFMPQDDDGGLGDRQLRHVPATLDRLRAAGFTTVRLFVSEQLRGVPRLVHALDTTVRAARQRGLVVLLANAYDNPTRVPAFLTWLAARYAVDPGVWLTPSNEPHCAEMTEAPLGYPDAACGDWAAWQAEESRFVAAVRAGGMRSPVLVNTPAYSWDLRGAVTHPLGDDQIVLGAHRYGDNNRDIRDRANAQHVPETRACDLLWANLARSRAVVVDEVGAYNRPGVRNSPAWAAGMADYLRDWVLHRGGSGAIGFNWSWDAGSMTSGGTGVGPLTPWGRAWLDRFVRPVAGAHR